MKADYVQKTRFAGDKPPHNANRRLAWLETSQDLHEQEGKPCHYGRTGRVRTAR
jgi:hypothetical protein